jgi:hypothetical protein
VVGIGLSEVVSAQDCVGAYEPCARTQGSRPETMGSGSNDLSVATYCNYNSKGSPFRRRGSLTLLHNTDFISYHHDSD